MSRVTKPKKKSNAHFVYLHKAQIITLSLTDISIKQLTKSIKSGSLKHINLPVNEGLKIEGIIEKCYTGIEGAESIADKKIRLRKNDLVIYLKDFKDAI